jgi:hypothetical protein
VSRVPLCSAELSYAFFIFPLIDSHYNYILSKFCNTLLLVLEPPVYTRLFPHQVFHPVNSRQWHTREKKDVVARGFF